MDAVGMGGGKFAWQVRGWQLSPLSRAPPAPPVGAGREPNGQKQYLSAEGLSHPHICSDVMSDQYH